MTTKWPALAALLFMGCGGQAESSSHEGDVEQAPLFHSGSRLKAEVLRAEGAPPALLKIFDSAENRPCGFHLAQDGERRCLPAPFVAVAVFADAECKEPLVGQSNGTLDVVAALGGCSSSPPIATVSHAWNCGAEPLSVYELEPVATPDVIYQLGENGCEGSAPPTGWNAPPPLYRLVAEVDPARFVSASRVDVRESEHVVRHITEAEDGSRWSGALYDELLATECTPAPAYQFGSYAPEQQHETYSECLIADLGWRVVSFEPDCKNDDPVGVMDTACYELGQSPPKYIDTPDGWAHLTEEPVATSSFVQTQNGCVESSREVYFGPAAPVTEPLLRLDLVELGEGRVKLSAFAVGGRVVATGNVPYASFIDSKRGKACQPYDTPDGIVCVTGADQPYAEWSSFYADDAQREKLLWSSPENLPEFVVERELAESDTCSVRYQLPRIAFAYPIGEKYSGPVFDENGVPSDPIELEGATFYRLGAAVSWDEFPHLQSGLE